MVIEVLNQKIECENTEQNFHVALEQANDLIEQAKETLSYAIIDGVEVYEDVNGYILGNIDNIQHVQLITKTLAQLINEVIVSNQQYLSRISEGLPHLSGQFYQSPTDGDWGELIQFIDGMQWLFQLADTLDQLQKQSNFISNWEDHLVGYADLNQGLGELMEATENKDTVLMADILQYEIKPKIDHLLHLTNQYIDNEVANYELN